MKEALVKKAQERYSASLKRKDLLRIVTKVGENGVYNEKRKQDSLRKWKRNEFVTKIKGKSQGSEVERYTTMQRMEKEGSETTRQEEIRRKNYKEEKFYKEREKRNVIQMLNGWRFGDDEKNIYDSKAEGKHKRLRVCNLT